MATEYTHTTRAQLREQLSLRLGDPTLNKADNRFNNLLICYDSYHRWLHWDMSIRYMREHFGSGK